MLYLRFDKVVEQQLLRSQNNSLVTGLTIDELPAGFRLYFCTRYNLV